MSHAMHRILSLSMTRTKSPNFSELEKSILLELVEIKKEILENKQNDMRTIEKKNQVWSALCDEFNSRHGVIMRTVVQLKAFWKNLKMRRKTSMAKDARERMKISGGPRETGRDKVTDAIWDMLPQRIHPLAKSLDHDDDCFHGDKADNSDEEDNTHAISNEPHSAEIGSATGPHSAEIGIATGPHSAEIGSATGPHSAEIGSATGPHSAEIGSATGPHSAEIGSATGPHSAEIGPPAEKGTTMPGVTAVPVENGPSETATSPSSASDPSNKRKGEQDSYVKSRLLEMAEEEHAEKMSFWMLEKVEKMKIWKLKQDILKIKKQKLLNE